MIMRKYFLVLLLIILGCSGNNGRTTAISFPQGVASGDPRPNSVVIWTRIKGSKQDVKVKYEVSSDKNFNKIIKEGYVKALSKWDNTIHLKINNLSPFTHYYFKFCKDNVCSETGRTLTAPLPNQDINVKFAVTYGQSYVGRYFKAYKIMKEIDSDIDFIIFLGDYVYEVDKVKGAIDPTPDRYIKFPDGRIISSDYYGNSKVAWTLADYRELYKIWLSDPDLKEIRRLYPFIVMWDDHEFANDCWKDNAEDLNGRIGEEKEKKRREVSTQAFWEYIPLDVNYYPQKGYPNDITMYRSFKYGKNVELFMTDQRYYRDQPIIDPGPVNLKTGKIMANNILGSRILVPKKVYDKMEEKKKPSMLGKTQFNWLINDIKHSSASWKFIGNPTMLSQFLLDLRQYKKLPPNLKQLFYFKLDQWDGYRSERKKLLEDIKNISNTVFLTGDLHASISSLVYTDYDDPVTPVSVEYMGPSISSVSLKEQLEAALNVSPLLEIIGKFANLNSLIENSDTVIKNSNPYYNFVNLHDYGYMVIEVNGDKNIKAKFVLLSDVWSKKINYPVKTVEFLTESNSNKIIFQYSKEVTVSN